MLGSAGHQETKDAASVEDRLRVSQLRFECPSCHVLLEVSAELAGVTGPCPGCGQAINAPESAFASESPGRAARGPGPSEVRSAQVVPGRPSEASFSPSHLADVERPASRETERVGASLERVGGTGGWQRKQKDPERVRREVRSRPGHFIRPSTMLSDKSQDRQEKIAVIKLVVALLLTLATVIVIVKLTKKGFATPPPGTSSEVLQKR